MNLFALTKLSYGLYIVATKEGEKINGQIANTVFQVTAEPIKVAVALNKLNLTHEMVSRTGKFSVSVLTQEAPFTFIGKFGFKTGRDVNKFESVNYRISDNGLPIVLDYTCAYIECKVVNSFDAGTHTIFLGEVIDADILSENPPMTYDYYHKEVKGKTPKTASTYIKEERKE
jgi:ferric-chelate reductase [NAD(P)H]